MVPWWVLILVLMAGAAMGAIIATVLGSDRKE